MRDVEQAFRILSGAQDSLSALMKAGVEDRRFEDVRVVAQLAQEFAQFLKTVKVEASPATSAADGVAVLDGQSVGEKQPRARGAKPGAKEYPRYRREGDRLVKVGWSRKGRQEYEHRAPRGAVDAFVEKVRGRDEPDDLFTMEELLPLNGEDGEEIPSYQAYLALGWLRSERAVTKDGRDGYRADLSKLDADGVDELWNSLTPGGTPNGESES